MMLTHMDQPFAARPTPPSADAVSPHKWAVLVTVTLGVFMANLDASIVNISLPMIARSFGVSVTGSIEWVVIAYLVIIAAVLLTVGRLADLIGRTPVWLGGLLLFTTSSALCGAAPSLGTLIVARGLQGLGAALLMAVGPAILIAGFPPTQRGRALGLLAVVAALAASAGPTVGGLVTTRLSWHWIFYVNVPLGIIGILLTRRVPRVAPRKGSGSFDPLGSLLLALGMVLLTLGLSFGQDWGWSSPRLLGALLGTVGAFGVFALVERRVASPVIDATLFRERVFLWANLSQLLSFCAVFAVTFLLPFYLEELRGWSAAQAGLLLTPLPLTMAVVAPLSGALADRLGARGLAAGGLAVTCAGLLLLSQLTVHSAAGTIMGALVVIGLGQALFQAPTMSAILGAAPEARRGSASSFLATGRVLGQSVSVALAGAIFTGLGAAAAGRRLIMQAGAHGGGSLHRDALEHTFMQGVHAAFLACAIVAALGLVTVLLWGKEA